MDKKSSFRNAEIVVVYPFRPKGEQHYCEHLIADDFFVAPVNPQLKLGVIDIPPRRGVYGCR
jgi:hypothetical protein